MSKKITTSLDGKELTLYVTVPRFYNLFKQATGKDLLVMAVLMKGNQEMVDLIEIGKGIVYAGYYTECQRNKTTPIMTKEEIFEAIDFTEDNYHIKIINQWSEVSNSTDVPGEQNGQLKDSVLTT